MYHPEHDMRGDYNYDMARQGDMRNDYARQGGYAGHYSQGQGSTYYPIQAMGTFEGYYGMPEQDYAGGGRRDYAYDMRYDMRGGDYVRGGRRDYGYDNYEYDTDLTTMKSVKLAWRYADNRVVDDTQLPDSSGIFTEEFDSRFT